MVSSNATYVRWRKGESRRCRVFPALEPDHPAFDAACLLCHNVLGANISNLGVQVVAIGPDEGHSDRFMQGQWTACHALICHTFCVLQRSDRVLDAFVLTLRMEDIGPESEAV